MVELEEDLLCKLDHRSSAPFRTLRAPRRDAGGPLSVRYFNNKYQTRELIVQHVSVGTGSLRNFGRVKVSTAADDVLFGAVVTSEGAKAPVLQTLWKVRMLRAFFLFFFCCCTSTGCAGLGLLLSS